MEEQIRKSVLLVMMAILAWQDIKEKRICLYLPVASAVLGIAGGIICKDMEISDMLGGGLVGVVIMLLGLVSRQSIGMGDGLVLIMCGIFVGFWTNMVLLMLALGIAGVAGMYLLVVKKKGKDYRMPFLPYLLAAYMCVLL